MLNYQRVGCLRKRVICPTTFCPISWWICITKISSQQFGVQKSWIASTDGSPMILYHIYKNTSPILSHILPTIMAGQNSYYIHSDYLKAYFTTCPSLIIKWSQKMSPLYTMIIGDHILTHIKLCPQ